MSHVNSYLEEERVGQVGHTVVTAVKPVEYVPAMHQTQALSAAAPVVVRNLPAGQMMHVDSVVAPVAVEYLPAPQLMHATEPVLVLNFPASHATQGPPSAPVYPALH